ncbi:MAG: site-2 protease family protein [Phycisphaerae bacterium]|nr:site-2 protease family protein [Phycisphaerae bacterium]
MNFILLGMIWYIVFVISVTVHEASHAFAALKFGDDTAHRGGQVSLHPLPHIMREPFGTILVPLVSYALGGFMIGWASAPYDPVWAARNPKKAAYMGLAGPASNLLLVVVAGILIHVGIWAGWFYKPETILFSTVVEAVSPGIATGPAVMLSLLFSLNCLLFVFNLIPVPPLDGTALLELSLKGESLAKYRQLMSNPTASFVGLIIAWNLFDFVFSPIHSMALNILYPGSHYQ